MQAGKKIIRMRISKAFFLDCHMLQAMIDFKAERKYSVNHAPAHDMQAKA